MALINVQLEAGGPVTQMDETELVKTAGGFEDSKERTNWVEYRLKSDPGAQRAVHRSVDMYLKRGLLGEGIAASF